MLDPDSPSWIELQLLIGNVDFPEYFHLKLAAVRTKGSKNSAVVEQKLLQQDLLFVKRHLNAKHLALTQATDTILDLSDPFRALYLYHLADLNRQIAYVCSLVLSNNNFRRVPDDDLVEIDLVLAE